MKKMKDLAKHIYDEWETKYRNELERLRKEKNNPDYHEGWCIIETDEFIKTLDDVVGLIIFGFDDNAYGTIEEWIKQDGENDTYLGFKLKDIMQELEKYFEQ
ncbi:MAG: hypothetical protein UHN47_07115 [Lachnospiraceae bacterium]|nr:hypothetical protein [Lachnospiraceae bacterium]